MNSLLSFKEEWFIKKKLCVALVSLFLLSSQANAFALINREFNEESIASFFELAKEKDAASFLDQVTSKYPDLRLVVVDLPIMVEEIRGPLIDWQDPNVSSDATKVYRDYTETMVQSIAYHLGKGKPIELIPDRPLMDHPLIVVNQRAPRHALLHELVHMIVDQSTLANTLAMPSDANREFLESIYDRVGEEVFVDTLILKNRESLGLSKRAICQRNRYLNQNLQLLDYFMSEIKYDSENSLVKAHIMALREARKEVSELKDEIFWGCL